MDDLQMYILTKSLFLKAALKAVKKDMMTDPGIVGTSDLKVLVKGNYLLFTLTG